MGDTCTTRQPALFETSVNGSLQRHIEALGLPDRAAYRSWCRREGFRATLNKTWRQRGRERCRAERIVAESERRITLTRHLERLGWTEIEQYAAWCEAHGKKASVYRSEAQLQQERRAAQREYAASALARERESRRRPEALLLRMFDGSLRKESLRTDGERIVYHAIYSLKRNDSTRSALQRLLHRFRCDVNGLTSQPFLPHIGCGETNMLITALVRAAKRHCGWIRDPESWKPTSNNLRRRFRSLASHLFANYAPPDFLEAAWFEEGERESRRHITWYLHLGAGRNLRSVDLPIVLTKRMAHFALKAPANLPVESALRWAQVLGMGGSARMAAAVLRTRLRWALRDEEFWATVIRFFVNNPMLDPARIESIVEFVHSRTESACDADGPNEDDDRDRRGRTQFTMKGRSAAALVALADEWRRKVDDERRPARQWAPSGISGFELVRSNGTVVETWTVRELLSSKELHREGRYMHNCVATYHESCARGECSIWSVRRCGLYEPAGVRVLTVEAEIAGMRIVQVRGRFNRLPGDPQADEYLDSAPPIVRLWADAAALTVDELAY